MHCPFQDLVVLEQEPMQEHAPAGDADPAFQFHVDELAPPPPPPPPPSPPSPGRTPDIADMSEDSEGEDLRIDFTASIFVAGILHIISNLTKDLNKSLHHFKTWVDQLKDVCKLLKRRWSRDRLKESCLSSGRLLYGKHLFDGFQAMCMRSDGGQSFMH